MYRQLTQEKRYTLYVLRQDGYSLREIASRIGVHVSTVSRELKRNVSGRGYRPQAAHRQAVSRRRVARKPNKLTPEVKHLLISLLKKHWSPEQIAGRLCQEDRLRISHETIYRFIRENRDRGGKLYKYLRRKKPYRRIYGSMGRYRLDAKVSIDDRPSVVDQKCRVGDWEIDTIVGAENMGPSLVTIVERVSKFTIIAKAPSKQYDVMTKVVHGMLKKHKNNVLTITADNGVEFSCHRILARLLDAEFYFAHPYCSWERGLNENTNGLIRQYLPKGSSFDLINRNRLRQIMSNINNRPRKTLGYRTPREVFFNQGVALQC